MELKVWEGDWDLPSIDVDCLQIMAYAKFSGAPIKIQKCSNPWHSPTGKLPLFKHGPKVQLTCYSDIVAHLRKQNYSADFNLTAQQQADVAAYFALLRDKIYPALLYVFWVDPKNYVDVTRPWYAKNLIFPLRYFLPGQMQKASQNLIDSDYRLLNVQESQIETCIYKDAEECLTLLSQRLGNKRFFFGNSPSSLDAMVFAYLAPLLKTPVPNAALQNYLKACPNLNQFVCRIIQHYFPSSLSDAKNNAKLSNATADLDFPNKWRNIILTSLVGMFAMVGYALAVGLVQIEITDTRDIEDEGEDEVDEEQDETSQNGND